MGDGTSIIGLQAFGGDFGLHRLRSEDSPDPRWGTDGRIGLGGALRDDSNKFLFRTADGGLRRGVDPNHRVAADPAVIEMLAQGWFFEGTAFGAPPATQ